MRIERMRIYLNTCNKKRAVSHEVMGLLNMILLNPREFWWWESNGLTWELRWLVLNDFPRHRE